MNRKPSFRALLLLILAMGPLQAHAVFACFMMDTVVHDECCCEAAKIEADPCTNPGCNAAVGSSEDPCCERSVEVTVDHEAGQDALTVKPAEVRSDVDPPQALVSSFVALFPPRPFPTQGIADRLPGTGQSGSDTWLLTQRLRI